MLEIRGKKRGRGVKHSGRVGARHDPPSHLERVMVKRCHVERREVMISLKLNL